jgi:hypothetical protein
MTKPLKSLFAVFFWLSAYLAMVSLFAHLFSVLWAQVEADPFPAFLAFIPASTFMVFVFVRMFSGFWYGVRK